MKIILTLFLFISISAFSQSDNDTTWKEKYIQEWNENPDNFDKILVRGNDGEIIIINNDGTSNVILFSFVIILFSILLSKKKTKVTLV
jgi:hypothetical protein